MYKGERGERWSLEEVKIEKRIIREKRERSYDKGDISMFV
jgi:hypothetical protein